MLRYPITLDAGKENWVMFYSYGKDNADVSDVISLYMPPAVSFGDGASYGNLDLGIMGSAAAGVGEALFGGGADGIRKAKEQLKAKAGGDDPISKAALSTAFTNFGLGSDLAERPRDLYLQSKGKAINPNTVLQYSNAELRSFSFSFKMVAESEKEANEIKKILGGFRRAMYGKKQGLTLAYPAKWLIMFMTPTGINKHLPRIYHECYLESLETNYNTTSNLTHKDGAPTEVEVQITFRESKVLARDDIDMLEPM